MSEPESQNRFELPKGVQLERRPNPGGMPVLLVHGGGAWSGTFAIPGPDIGGRPRCLRDWLWERGFEPWLLDWRASVRIVDGAKDDALLETFDLDHAAASDIPEALARIRNVRDDAESIGVVGHCLGGGLVAQAIAEGHLGQEEQPRVKPRVTHVVLLTLGLFYRPSWERRLIADDGPLERLWSDPTREATVDPRPGRSWPALIGEYYQEWPIRNHDGTDLKPAYEVCNKVGFIYGPPYRESILVPEIHEDTWMLSFLNGRHAPLPGQTIEGEQSQAQGTLHAIEVEKGSWKDASAAGVLWLRDGSGEFVPGESLKVEKEPVAHVGRLRHDKAQLPEQFGAIPLRMYLQAVRNVRRNGRAGKFNEPETSAGFLTPGCRKRFDALCTTLITGDQNKLWGRTSVDDMYEWLVCGKRPLPRRCKKVVLRGYAHQDLLWGRSAHNDVFPEIEAGLR